MTRFGSIPGTIILLLLCNFLLGQQGLGDTLHLEEVVVSDAAVKTGEAFREERYSLDSLSLTRATLGENLRRNTAIFVKSYGGNGVATISLRGTSANHTNVYWNNLDLGSPLLGVTDLSSIPIQAADDMSIQYGFASLNDGSGGIGGSIRLNNSWQSLDNSILDVSLYAGSFGRYEGWTRLNIKRKRWAMQFGVLRYAADNNFYYQDNTEPGYPERQMTNAGFNQSALWSLIYYRISDKEQLSLKTVWTHTDRQVPPPLTGNQQVFDEMNDQRLMSILEYQRFSHKSRLLASSGLVRDNNDFTNGADSVSYLNQFISWQNSLRYQHKFSGILSMESGGRFRAEQANSPSYSGEVIRYRSSLFTDWRFNPWQPLEFSLILREELIDNDFSPLLGAIGMTWHIDSLQNLRLHVARNYRYATLNDLYWNPGGNASLRPETSYNLEAGYELRIPNLPLLNLGVFHNIIDNWIQWRPAGSVWSPRNIRKVANSGIEAKLRDQLKLGETNWAWQADYSYTRSVSIAEYDGIDADETLQLPFVPKHILGFGLEMQYRKYFFRYRQQVTGKYFTNSDNSVYMPGYSVANLSFGLTDILKSQRHALAVTLEFNNLFNYTYQVLPYRPEPGFNMGIRLKYNLLR